jgi:hypothetical protein
MRVLSSALGYSPRLLVSDLVRTLQLEPYADFLGKRSNDFRIINAVGLAARAILIARSLFRLRPRFSIYMRCRNINLLSIVYACRPRLRFRLTLGGFTFPRKP